LEFRRVLFRSPELLVRMHGRCALRGRFGPARRRPAAAAGAEMSAREDRVNRELRALEAAYRHGQFDRAGYRARRRTLLSALRARDEITARNAIVPAGRRRTGAGGTSEAGSSILFDQGTTT